MNVLRKLIYRFLIYWLDYKITTLEQKLERKQMELRRQAGDERNYQLGRNNDEF